jgi:maltose alpha-D-glucosyltransferase/alpha-amylase
MGTRLAELHRVLARPSTDPAFSPEAVTEADVNEWSESSSKQMQAALDKLSSVKEWPSETSRDAAAFALCNQKKILGMVSMLAKTGLGTLKTRVHGDFHLGQVLCSSGDAYIIDSEGEPAKSVDARRAKTSPLRDVAGLIRSLPRARYLSSPSAAQACHRRHLAHRLKHHHNPSYAVPCTRTESDLAPPKTAAITFILPFTA